jgi:hypothetical protein
MRIALGRDRPGIRAFAIQFGEQYCYKDRKTAFEKQAATKSNQRNKPKAQQGSSKDLTPFCTILHICVSQKLLNNF